MTTPWYRINRVAPSASAGQAGEGDQPNARTEILIFGDIGESWYSETVTAAQFVRDLAAIDDAEITIRINSMGGSVPDGLAIYNAIRRHPAKITTINEGMALSCASLILIAGDQVEAAENAVTMIHAPWTYAAGNAKRLREVADELDVWSAGMANNYAARSGLSADEVKAAMLDGADHYYTAAEALDAGLIDAVVDATPESAQAAGRLLPQAMARFTRPTQPVPAAAAANLHKETTMTTPVTPAAEPNAAANRDAILAAERARQAAIRAAAKPFGAVAGLGDLVQALCDNPATDEAAAREQILAHLGKQAAPVAGTVETVEDETDKHRAEIVDAMIVRAGLADTETRRRVQAGNRYRGDKMLDIARASLDRAQFNYRGLGQMEIVAAAFTQSTSDFPVLLENAMHKVLQAAYAVAPDTWTRFCKRGSVADFRDHPRYRVGSLGNLDAITELGEFKNKTIPDGEKGTVKAGTKGNVINLSRQAIINDDLGAFLGLADSLGRSAKRTVEADVYALLALNSGAGPTMADGYALFSSQHNNLTTGAAISVAALDADRVAMMSQLDVGGNDYLDLRPAVLLVAASLGGTARVLNESQYDPDTANKLQRANMVAGLFRDIVDTPRLSGTRRYLFADPADAPVIEVAFLDGNDMPYLEVQDGFDVDGARMKGRLDFGVAAIDYRGAVSNAGA